MTDLSGTEYEGMILPMLAKDFNLKRLEKHFYHEGDQIVYAAQPKLDGVRMIWTGEQFHSRMGKPIATRLTTLQEQIRNIFYDFPLDGELYVHNPDGDEAFRKVVSNVRSTDEKHDEDTEIEYWVYDTPIDGIPFYDRWDRIMKFFDFENAPEDVRIKLVPTSIGRLSVETLQDAKALDNGEDAIKKLINYWASEGFEGTMLRDIKSLYKFGGLSAKGKNAGKVSGSHGRSDGLLKVKSFFDSEALVTDMVEGLGKHKGRLGALVAEMDGKTFQIGTGFTDSDREFYWKFRNRILDKKVTVKYQNLTPDGIPRFPVFVEVRDYE